MTTRVPEMEAQSAAEQFMREHAQIKRDLMLTTDENTALKAQLAEAYNLNRVNEGVITDQREQIAKEQARTRSWLAYTMKLIAQLDVIVGIIGQSKTLAQQAAQEAQRISMDTEMPEDDREALSKLFVDTVGKNGTTPVPSNRFGGTQ